MAATTKKKAVKKPAKKKRPAVPGAKKKGTTAGTNRKPKKTGSVKKVVQKAGATKKVKKVAVSPAAGKRRSVTRQTKKRPVKGAPESRQDRLTALKRMLQARKESILKEARQEIAKYLRGENRQLVDTALDDGDWAVVDINEDISLRMLSAHRTMLHDIDEAIRKIGEGTYGICEECGEEISGKRLSILPAAVYCIDCQEGKEKMAALIKEQPL